MAQIPPIGGSVSPQNPENPTNQQVNEFANTIGSFSEQIYSLLRDPASADSKSFLANLSKTVVQLYNQAK